MADSFTANLNLTKPEIGASRDSWGTKLNADMDALDAIFAAGGSGTSVGLNVGSGKTLNIGASGTIIVSASATVNGLVTPTSTTTLTNKTISGSTNSLTNISIEGSTTGTLPHTRGGTGLTATPANGQLLIGNGSGFSLGTITAGTNITVTNSAGGISISSSGGGGGGGTVTSVSMSTGSTGLTVSGGTTQTITGSGSFIMAGTLGIANGGTGATTAASARTALSLGTLAVQNANTAIITGGQITGITDLAIADGGTGASTAAAALAALGGLPLAGGQMVGNILMATANASPGAGDTDVGACLASNGSQHLSNNGSYVQSINRNSDGNSVVFHQSGAVVGTISVTGSGTAYNTTSDYRAKDVRGAITNAIARFKLLAPKRVIYHADNLGREVDAFIAHELAEVVPEAVTGAKDAVDVLDFPIMQKVDHSKVMPLTAAAVLELIARVEALEAR